MSLINKRGRVAPERSIVRSLWYAIGTITEEKEGRCFLKFDVPQMGAGARMTGVWLPWPLILMPMPSDYSPWGFTRDYHDVLEGIRWFTTPSHGGYRLTEEREAELQKKFEFKSFNGLTRWYEEDCDSMAVLIAFYEEFSDPEVYSQPINWQEIVTYVIRMEDRGNVKWSPVVRHILNHPQLSAYAGGAKTEKGSES